MKEIQLTRGKAALVDDSDYEWLNQWKWGAHESNDKKRWYARRRENGKHVTMHRIIMGVTDPKIKIDHKNFDGLDNQRHNLRKCTQGQNQSNRGKQSNNTTGFKGVSWNKERRKYRASIRVDGKLVFLGYFSNPDEAAKAYDLAAQTYFREFSHLNFPK